MLALRLLRKLVEMENEESTEPAIEWDPDQWLSFKEVPILDLEARFDVPAPTPTPTPHSVPATAHTLRCCSSAFRPPTSAFPSRNYSDDRTVSTSVSPSVCPRLFPHHVTFHRKSSGCNLSCCL